MNDPTKKSKDVEFYNLYELYSENGIKTKITISSEIYQRFRTQQLDFGKSMVNGFLSQKDIINDDFLALKKDRFERLLIFDREPFERTLKNC